MEIISKGKFCDYCSCDTCQGISEPYNGLESIECADGTNICSVCLFIEPCEKNVEINGKRTTRTFESTNDVYCENHPGCEHKPSIKNVKDCGFCGRKNVAFLKIKDEKKFICDKCYNKEIKKPCVIGSHGGAFCEENPYCKHKLQVGRII